MGVFGCWGLVSLCKFLLAHVGSGSTRQRTPYPRPPPPNALLRSPYVYPVVRGPR